MERAATERLEFLRAQPPNSPVWAKPSSGTVQGHPEWTWTITPSDAVYGDAVQMSGSSTVSVPLLPPLPVGSPLRVRLFSESTY